ncbi:MAG: hypothetical protein HFI63_06220 [Lachnospiraceae bacterium]|nr:hypothetical protein [Lachnospiraceae bacterium]
MIDTCYDGEACEKNWNEGSRTLEKLNEVSFLLNDLAVYLDSHPADERAVGWFDAYSAERKELLEMFEKQNFRG